MCSEWKIKELWKPNASKKVREQQYFGGTPRKQILNVSYFKYFLENQS